MASCTQASWPEVAAIALIVIGLLAAQTLRIRAKRADRNPNGDPRP